MKKLLLLSYEWSLRLTFAIVILLSASAFLLILVDFPKMDRELTLLSHLKQKPKKVARGLWIGGYHFSDKEFLKFLRKKRIGVVISLLDPDMAHEKELLLQERRLLSSRGIILQNVPIKPFIKDEKKIETARRLIKTWRRRGVNVYIHSYLGRVRVGYLMEEVRYGG